MIYKLDVQVVRIHMLKELTYCPYFFTWVLDAFGGFKNRASDGITNAL